MKGRLLLLAVLVASALFTSPMSRSEETPAGEPRASTEIPDVNPYSGKEQVIKKGQRAFRQNTCTACHGGRADGQGDMGSGADLRKLKIGFKRFVQTVKNGRKVEGRQQFMPSFAHLEYEEIFTIGAYLETLALPEANWKDGAKN